MTGERKFASAYTVKDGRTVVPLAFAPCAAWFVIFQEPCAAHPATASSNVENLQPVQEISGLWTLHFDPRWAGPHT